MQNYLVTLNVMRIRFYFQVFFFKEHGTKLTNLSESVVTSVSLPITTSVLNILIKSRQNFGLKNKKQIRFQQSNFNLKALLEIKILYFRT